MKRVFKVLPLILISHLFYGYEPALAQPGVS